MAIKETIDESLFISRFEDYKRVKTDKHGGNFTYKGLRYLFDYIDQMSEDINQDIELDVIALCCEYSEYADLNEWLNDYGNDELKKQEDETDQQHEERLREHISDNTALILFGDTLNDGFIIGQY